MVCLYKKHISSCNGWVLPLIRNVNYRLRGNHYNMFLNGDYLNLLPYRTFVDATPEFHAVAMLL